jgi:putative NIF3 family GTP cyclohydrolase 1 type 2
MIISHHPLFFVPLKYTPLEGEGFYLNIYCAHTNLDIAQGGTTDVLIENVINADESSGKLFNSIPLTPCGRGQNCLVNGSELSNSGEGFLRYLDTNININDFITILKQISPHLRYVNNKNIQALRKIAFCAGSGADFIEEAHQNGADALVTGDLKFHTALDSPIVLFDIEHFESEIGVLKVFETLINNDVEVIYAQEKSPFNY